MRTLLVCLLAAAPVCSQKYVDDFNRANALNDWKMENGSWQIQNGRLLTNGATTWSYITLQNPALKPVDCMLEGEFFYVGSGVQFAGLTARYLGPGDSNCVMCKIQNNGGAADFDRCFIYERVVGTNVYKDLTMTNVLRAKCRMEVVGGNATMTVDQDLDGEYELNIGTKPLTNALGAGLIGMNCYGTSEMDNFKFYNAILRPLGSSIPKIGTTFQMELLTPATTITPFVCALSLGNTGIPIGATNGSPRSEIPLSADLLLNFSLAVGGSLGLVGITDNTGVGKPQLKNIPNDPNLVGIKIHVAGVTPGFEHISNDLAVRFVQ